MIAALAAALVLPAGAPTQEFHVPVGKSVQAAVTAAAAAGGGRVTLDAGSYQEQVKLTSRSKAPVWIICTAGPAATTITAPASAPAVIQGLGTSNDAVIGCGIRGGRNGIQFGQSGEDFSWTVAHILIQGNDVRGAAEDAIKISQADDVTITGNTVASIGQQGVDLLDTNVAKVDHNDCSAAGVAACLEAKGGSMNVLFSDNVVHDLVVKNVAGLELGGYTQQQYVRPAHRGFQARGLMALRNHIDRVWGQAVILTGCVSCAVALNTGTLGPGAYFAMGAQPDDLGRMTADATVHFNSFSGRPAWGVDKAQDSVRDKLAFTR